MEFSILNGHYRFVHDVFSVLSITFWFFISPARLTFVIKSGFQSTCSQRKVTNIHFIFPKFFPYHRCSSVLAQLRKKHSYCSLLDRQSFGINSRLLWSIFPIWLIRACACSLSAGLINISRVSRFCDSTVIVTVFRCLQTRRFLFQSDAERYH